jgi:small-conductance mechanosensitive channel
MKLLLAWIIIGVCLQFVDNTVIRSLLTLTILIIAALSVFGILDETTGALDAIGFSFGHLRFSALSVLKGILSIFILFYIALFASAFLERKVLKSRTLTRSSQVLTIRVLRTALIVFAIVIGVTSAGIDLTAFLVFAGAIGLGLGFGLQKVVSNLVSGMLLLMDKSINPGDIIELEKTGTYGWVNHITARYTEIVTRENKSYLIPNEDFITQRVVNWSHGSRLIRLDVKFGVHYDSDPRRVIDLTVAAAKIPARVVDTPEPTCNFAEFGENALNFTLSFWIKDAEQGIGNVKSEVMLALWDSLKANGIRIPYPQREIHMHSGDKS